MDLINNLLFTSRNSTAGITGKIFGPINPDFIDLPDLLPSPFLPDERGGYYAYNIEAIKEFCAVEDSDFIENSIQKHWADIINGRSYTDINPSLTNPPPDPGPTIYFSRFRTAPPAGNILEEGNLIPPYHLIYAYLVENTRSAQIFEKLLYLYTHDEKLNKATTAQDPNNRLAFQWMVNTENLFFKHLSSRSYRNVTSQFRVSPDATRRNAYFRMFGMDLAFGDMVSNGAVNFYKAEFNNQPFIILFEKFLTEIWQAYTNARNQMGPNTTDMFVIVDTAQKMQEMLMARRTTETNFNNYRYFNLSKEEYAAVVMMSWLYEVVSYDSPIVQFLRCNGNTPGERLINIGNKVGVPAHSKSEGLLDIAPPMNTLLRRIELGDYNVETEVRTIIESQTPTSSADDAQKRALGDLLLIINNWEKATGHRIKNAEAASITGSVRIHQNGVQQNGVKAQTVMN
ncbi:MAG: hypothetical protein ABWZ25_01455 [Chitinophagaceae bacterium]